jgi:hypothetical protein
MSKRNMPWIRVEAVANEGVEEFLKCRVRVSETNMATVGANTGTW